MIEVFLLCTQFASGWSCLPTKSEEDCYRLHDAIHTSIAHDVQCELVELAPGTIYAPNTAPQPMPKVKP